MFEQNQDAVIHVFSDELPSDYTQVFVNQRNIDDFFQDEFIRYSDYHTTTDSNIEELLQDVRKKENAQLLAYAEQLEKILLAEPPLPITHDNGAPSNSYKIVNHLKNLMSLSN